MVVADLFFLALELMILLFVVDISRRLRLLERHLIRGEATEERRRLFMQSPRWKGKHVDSPDH